MLVVVFELLLAFYLARINKVGLVFIFFVLFFCTGLLLKVINTKESTILNDISISFLAGTPITVLVIALFVYWLLSTITFI